MTYMARKTITEDVFKQMKNDYENGSTIDDIVEKYQFKKNTIKLHFNKHGIYFTNTRKFTEKEINSIIIDYQNGMKPFELAKKYDRDSATIIGKLQSIGVYEFSSHRFTDEEIDFLKVYYPLGDWKSINERLPNVSRQSIHTKMSSLGISMDSHYWSNEEEKILIDNYEFMYGNINELIDLFNGKYTYKSIISKAGKLGLKTREFWSDKEIQILIANYSNKTLDEMLELLPSRNRNTIISKAGSLNLTNKIKLDYQYSEDDKIFIINNYNNMSDREIAEKLNRNTHNISDFRYKYNLLKTYEKSSYEDIADFIRKNNSNWKKDSMKQCNYKCILSGKRFDEIHHIYGFNFILAETFDTLEINIKEDINDYSREELMEILDCFRNIQSIYHLGVCLTKELHCLFHKIYGYGNNSEWQWNDFVKNYKEGKYNNFLNVT